MMLSPALDLFPLLAAILAAVCCALLGNFLVLRRISLMGDAMSHSVLPGLVIAFLITGSRSAPVMFVGAALAGIATVVLVELIKRLGRVEPGAAMGVVFSVLFALGVLLIERAARNTELDADCVLHGQLESLVWDGPSSWSALGLSEVIQAAPPSIWTLVITCVLAILLVVVLFKELRLAAFDPAFGTSQGFSATALHYVLMVFVAGATVAAFEAVGSILVIAMLIVPASIARLLTDRLASQIMVSVVAAIAAAVSGYIGSFAIPDALGVTEVNAAGSMTVVLGLILVAAAALGPRYGVLASIVRRGRMARRIALDNLLASVFRAEERGRSVSAAVRSSTLARARRRGFVKPDAVELTATGRAAAAAVVRRHRMWESYLVDEAGLAQDHVHAPAEQLEHLMDTTPNESTGRDPHGRPIPGTSSD
ncbi:MAG: metal ABC transporter permease [Phycisphaerales bacterium]